MLYHIFTRATQILLLLQSPNTMYPMIVLWLILMPHHPLFHQRILTSSDSLKSYHCVVKHFMRQLGRQGDLCTLSQRAWFESQPPTLQSSFLLVCILGGSRWRPKYFAPCHPSRRPNWVPGFHLCPGLATMATMGTWEINKMMGDASVAHSLLSLPILSFSNNKYRNI